jgi:serine/threonine protein kinase
MILSNKYKVISKINSGSFGSVYRAQNIRTGEYVAIKIEKNSNQMKSIKYEAKIYQYLSGLDGFPKLKMYGVINNVSYLVTNLIGSSIKEMITNKMLGDFKSIINISIQIIKRIETLHEHCLIHRDIKPSNFLFNVETNKVYLIDFGFCKKYMDDSGHIPLRQISNIIGSVNFVSLNIHNKIEPSRRDDLESCIYIIMNMILGDLDWFNKEDTETIFLMKRNCININMMPNFIKELLEYVRQLAFDETPNYKYIIRTLESQL